MKIAVISDIHSNPRALRRVINSARKKGCEKFICCGDVVGYGYAPNECIEICKENDIECVKGNHDAALVGELSLDWFNPTAANGILANRPLVTDENKKWLASLPYQITRDFAETKVVFSHGTFMWPKLFHYIDDWYSAKCEMNTMRANGVDALFVGHTHGPGDYSRRRSEDDPCGIREPPKDTQTPMGLIRREWSEAIFNAGSVGYPRRCRYSTYIILDDDTFFVELIRIPFDYTNYCDNLKASGRNIPVWIEARTAFIRSGKLEE